MLITYISQPIIVRVADRMQGTQAIAGQEVRFVRLEHEEFGRFAPRVVITLHVTLYSLDTNGNFLAPLTDDRVGAYSSQLAADNNTVVDATTGAILATRLPGTSAEQWDATLAAFPGDYMYQGTFFLKMRDHQSVVIGDMIRLHIVQADAMGKFNG